MCRVFFPASQKPQIFIFFSILLFSFFLLFQGHLLIGNKCSDNDRICVPEEGKIRDAVIWLDVWQNIIFQGNLCLLLNPLLHTAHSHWTLLPIYRDPLAVFSCLTVLFPLGLVGALKKTLESTEKWMEILSLRDTQPTTSTFEEPLKNHTRHDYEEWQKDFGTALWTNPKSSDTWMSAHVIPLISFS